MIESAFPILEVPDLEVALAFYRDTLGANVRYRFPEDGDAVYVSLELGSSALGLGHAPDLVPVAGSFLLWIYVDDVDAATLAAGAAGYEVVEQPSDQPWGERVSLVLDPFGTRVRFGAPIPQG